MAKIIIENIFSGIATCTMMKQETGNWIWKVANCFAPFPYLCEKIP